MKQYIQFDESLGLFISNNKRGNNVCYLLSNVQNYGTDHSNFQKDPALFLGIATDDTSKISFLPASKIGNKELWNCDNRTMCKPGKVIRRILKENYIKDKVTNEDIEDFANKFRANFYKSDIIEVKGADISKYYFEDNYHRGPSNCGDFKGTLWESCMRHSSCYHDGYMEIYSDNPDKCSMLCVFDANKKVMARALLWHKIHLTGDETKYYTVMDRVYYYHDYFVPMFLKYAKDKGYLHKKNQGHSCQEFVKPDGTTMCKTFVIRLKPRVYQYYPYVDTFYHYDACKGVLSNDYYGDSMELREVDGNAADQVECYVSGDMIHRDEARYIEHRDVYVYEDYAYEIEHSGEYAMEDDVCWVPTHDWYAWHDDVCVDDYSGECIMVDESCELYNGEITHMDNTESYDDLYYLSEDMVYSDKEMKEIPKPLSCYINKKIGWMLKKNCTFVKGVNGNKDKWLPYNEDTLDL